MAKRRQMKKASLCEKTVCPSPEELSVIANSVKCEQCGVVFRNWPCYRFHNVRVHQHKNLARTVKGNVHYHCPVRTCIYTVNSQRYFSSMKYLKQHYLKVHAEKAYACKDCDKSFSTEAAKEAHTRVCGVEFTCSCSKAYTSYEALLTHAKRSSHVITDKYKRRINSSKATQVILPPGTTRNNKPVTILPSPDKSSKSNENAGATMPKSTSDVGVQTDECKKSRKIPSPSKLNNGYTHCNSKRRMSKQTQTNSSPKNGSEKSNNGRSTETQTATTRANKRGSRALRSSKQSEQHALLKEELNLGDNFASANLFPASPLPLRHDVGLQDLWEQKSTSGTQTIPEKDMFEAFNDNVTQTEFDQTLYEYSPNPLIQSITFDDRFSSIETQTEFPQAFSPSYLSPFVPTESLSRTFALSSNIETQTTANLDNMEQLLYSNTCTQTCNEMLPSDLGLMSNIQTQTAWSHDDTTVSTETQTKSLICEAGCNIPMGACRSWLNTQTSHTETQTDLLSIFEGLQ